jgi:hypothetical protein
MDYENGIARETTVTVRIPGLARCSLDRIGLHPEYSIGTLKEEVEIFLGSSLNLLSPIPFHPC